MRDKRFLTNPVSSSESTLSKTNANRVKCYIIPLFPFLYFKREVIICWFVICWFTQIMELIKDFTNYQLRY